MNTEFTYEQWEGQNEYVILGLGGPIGYTVTKQEAEVITKWLNSAYDEIRGRIIEETRNGMEKNIWF